MKWSFVVILCVIVLTSTLHYSSPPLPNTAAIALNKTQLNKQHNNNITQKNLLENKSRSFHSEQSGITSAHENERKNLLHLTSIQQQEYSQLNVEYHQHKKVLLKHRKIISKSDYQQQYKRITAKFNIDLKNIIGDEQFTNYTKRRQKKRQERLQHLYQGVDQHLASEEPIERVN